MKKKNEKTDPLTKKIMKNEEKIVEIDLKKLKTFHEHPFSVEDDADMEQLTESIKTNGVLSPVLIRPDASLRFGMMRCTGIRVEI